MFNVRTNEKISIKKIYKDFENKKKLNKNEIANIEINEKATINNTDILVSKTNNLIFTSSIKVTYIHVARDSKIIKSERVQFNFRNQKVYGYISKVDEKENSSIVSFLTIELENKIYITEYSKFDELAIFSM